MNVFEIKMTLGAASLEGAIVALLDHVSQAPSALYNMKTMKS